MVILKRASRAAGLAVSSSLLTGLFFLGTSPVLAGQQAPDPGAVSSQEPTSIALALPEDRGLASLQQTLRQLNTTASVMMIVAHPDDEDGALLTYLSRGLGARTILLTLTRGEGGQNAMSADTYDALGVLRTNELLAADQYYGTKQLWGTESDFGFSKTQEEAFARWGHERVLYDAVLAVRRERPEVIVATFVGAVSDGHGQHQVSGEIAQEVFKAAADPKVFPEQLKDGLEPWQPLAVYGMVPFAPITDKGMFDYATGKWAPARFHNYSSGAWTSGALSTDAIVAVGTRDPVLGRSYTQIAREGWGKQKSQYGGASPALSGPASSRYHLWAAAPVAEARSAPGSSEGGLFHNAKVDVDTSVAALARLAGATAPGWLTTGLRQIDTELKSFTVDCTGHNDIENAHTLASIYRETLDLSKTVAGSDLDAEAKAGLSRELSVKLEQFQSALQQLLGLDMTAFTTNASIPAGGSGRGNSADQTAPSVAPGQEFKVGVHLSQANSKTRLTRVWLESQTGDSWKSDLTAGMPDPAAAVSNSVFKVSAADNAQSTAPFFTRPSIEQPYYDISDQGWRERSFMPWPLAAWAEFSFEGVPVRIGEVVQTMHMVHGEGGIYEPLVVTPAVGVTITPEARILPLDEKPLPVSVTIHTQGAADGSLELKLPAGWRAEPTRLAFHQSAAGDSDPLVFSVTPSAGQTGAYTITAEAHVAGKTYTAGWRSVGYPGARPYNIYRAATLKTRKVDVKLAAGLRIGYVMGPGDLVPEAIEAMGVTPHLLSDADLGSGDLSAFNVIVVGIRAYDTRPALTSAQPRLDTFVHAGGTLVVQYQGGQFPAPLPLSLGRAAEKVVDEQAPVRLLEPQNPLLTRPNHITNADFEGWVEERGHSFLDSWNPGYSALTETADPGQDPQRGGLVVAHPGKGTYVYVAYALYRQLPELVPGSYRLLANLLSAGSE